MHENRRGWDYNTAKYKMKQSLAKRARLRANIKASDLNGLNRALRDYGITSIESIQMFIATLLHESGRGTIRYEYSENVTDAQWAAYVKKWKLNYTKYERGVGYIQLTWKDTQEKFLETIYPSSYVAQLSDSERLRLIADQHPAEASGWYWGLFPKSGKSPLNKYVDDNVAKGYREEEIFLVTQYLVNGFPAGQYADSDLKAVREGTATYQIDTNTSMLIVNGRTYKLPNGWEDRATKYDEVRKTIY